MNDRQPQPQVVAGFILLPDRQTAISISHVKVLHVTGREDPDFPRARNVRLVADMDTADETYVLGHFLTFNQAMIMLGDLLATIRETAGGDS